jgi:HEAT repeat protein
MGLFRSRKIDVRAMLESNDIKGLVKALRNRRWHARVDAVIALGNTKDPKVVKPLIKLLKSDKNIDVRKHAASALGSIGNASAVPALAEVLEEASGPFDPFPLRSEAIESLSRINHPSTRLHKRLIL